MCEYGIVVASQMMLDHPVEIGRCIFQERERKKKCNLIRESSPELFWILGKCLNHYTIPIQVYIKICLFMYIV